MTRPTVLLTGAAGVVGQSLQPVLADCAVIAGVHRLPGDGWARTLRLNLAEPHLGLSAEDYAALADEVDVVVHSAALTEWGKSPDRYEAVNVLGTRRVLELAQAASAPIHFISTCFVHALRPEAPFQLRPDNVVLPYITSKLAAERLLQASGHPLTTYRPTNLVGDSITGASSAPQIVQTMSELIARGRAPYFPVHSGNLIDVAPQDVLAQCVRAGVLGADLGPEVWVTYGQEAMRPEETVAICLEHARVSGRTVKPVAVADPTDLPMPLHAVPPLVRAYVKVLLDVSETVAACGGVLPSSLSRLHEVHGIQVPDDRLAYQRSLDYWAGQARAEAG